MCLASVSMLAQDTLRSYMEVRYRAAYVKDTVSGKVYADTFRLRFNDKRTFFFEERTFHKDSLRCYDIEAWSTAMSKSLTSNDSPDRAGNGYYVLSDYASAEYTYQDDIATSAYRYTDSLATFNWQILSEYKDISSHPCQKAVGAYMGRKYIAWFAKDLPYNYGPWKFHGLPGLIMEVADTQNQYSFSFLDMYPNSGTMQLFPQRHFKTTKAKFLKELRLYLKDPIGYFMGDNSAVKIDFGHSDANAWLVERIRSECRHQPMEKLDD